MNGQNGDVASHRKALDKTDSIERYTITHSNFSMSTLLIIETIGELHCENCFFVDKETFATCYSKQEQRMKSRYMEMLEQLFSSLTLV